MTAAANRWDLGDALTPEQIFRQWLPALRTGCRPDRDAVEDATYRVGRNAAPVLLHLMRRRAILSPDAASLAGSVWSGCEFPDLVLPRKTWLAIFNLAGPCLDGRPIERPTSTLTLYRGSTTARRRLWSWTDDRRIAERYAAGGVRGRDPGSVWVAEIPPHRLLARNTDRHESEWVVNTTGLKILPAAA